MNLEMDADLRAVVEFMQRRIPAARLVSVATGIQAISPLLWGHYPHEECKPLRLSACGPHTPPNASE